MAFVNRASFGCSYITLQSIYECICNSHMLIYILTVLLQTIHVAIFFLLSSNSFMFQMHTQQMPVETIGMINGVHGHQLTHTKNH